MSSAKHLYHALSLRLRGLFSGRIEASDEKLWESEHDCPAPAGSGQAARSGVCRR